jgi:hypothetical protein
LPPRPPPPKKNPHIFYHFSLNLFRALSIIKGTVSLEMRINIFYAKKDTKVWKYRRLP